MPTRTSLLLLAGRLACVGSGMGETIASPPGWPRRYSDASPGRPRQRRMPRRSSPPSQSYRLTAAGPVEPGEACIKINVRVEGTADFTTNTVRGTLVGGGVLHGTAEGTFVFTSVDQETGTATYEGTYLITTRHGTLALDLFDGFIDLATLSGTNDSVVTGGTGRFEGATGSLFFEGAVGPGDTFTDFLTGRSASRPGRSAWSTAIYRGDGRLRLVPSAVGKWLVFVMPEHGGNITLSVMTERGASSVEYALLLALVAALVIVAMARVGTSIDGTIRVLGTRFERGPDGQPVDANACSGNSEGKTDENANNCHDK